MTRHWRCPDCQQLLGTVRYRGNYPTATLVIADRVERVDQRIWCYVIHCPCGGYRAWRDGRVVLPDKGR